MSKLAKMVNDFAAQQEPPVSGRSSKPIRVSPRDLIDDPDNKNIYDDYGTEEEIADLAADMEKSGFFGLITVYPCEGGYKIESGHRRKYAAIKAGIDKVEVYITEAPKSDIERRKRLIRANLHNRKENPIKKAREISYQYKTIEMERAQYEGMKFPHTVAEEVATNFEISTSQVSRYCTLLKLIPELQTLLTKHEQLPWVVLCEATDLTEEQQRTLYERITGAILAYGVEQINNAFVRKQITACSLLSDTSYHFDQNSIKPTSPEPILERTRKNRRMNGARTLAQGSEAVHKALDYNTSYIKEAQRGAVLENLKELSEYINNAIKKLEQDGFDKRFNRKLK